MKKILFATTALVATASVAAADVTVSGYGRFGVKYSGSVAEVTGSAGELSAADVTAAAALNTAVVLVAAPTVAADLIAVDAAITATVSVVGDTTLALSAAGQATIAEAAADIVALTALRDSISGTADVAAIASDTLVTSRLRLNIAASTESDSGVTFGMSVRVQQDDGNTNAFNAVHASSQSQVDLSIACWQHRRCLSIARLVFTAGSVGLTGLGYGNVVTGFGYTSTMTDKRWRRLSWLHRNQRKLYTRWVTIQFTQSRQTV
ncbi:hypothetical protein [Lentibacter algarum]|uniref:hypothetical protein n=1 Tax=Lentibacter algarum TaxID=576131 RepID=UPI003AF751FF